MAVSAPNSRQKGLRSAYLDAYDKTGKEAEPWLDVLFRSDSSDGAYEDYNVPEALPGLLIWRDGDPIPGGSGSELGHQITMLRWGREIDYSVDEAADNRSMRSHAQRARMIGEDAALLRERCAYSLLSGNTSQDALPYIPNAFDGYSIISTNHREHTYGNHVGFQNQDADERTFMVGLINLAMRRWREMTKPGTNGRKLFTTGELDRANIHLFHPPSKETLILDALESQSIYREDSGGASAAAPDNAIARVYRGRIKPHVFGEMEDSDGYYAVLEIPGSDKRPFLEIDRQAMEWKYFGPDNDGEARRYKREGVGVNLRRGYGAHMHYMLLHLDTSLAVQ